MEGKNTKSLSSPLPFMLVGLILQQCFPHPQDGRTRFGLYNARATNRFCPKKIIIDINYRSCLPL